MAISMSIRTCGTAVLASFLLRTASLAQNPGEIFFGEKLIENNIAFPSGKISLSRSNMNKYILYSSQQSKIYKEDKEEQKINPLIVCGIGLGTITANYVGYVSASHKDWWDTSEWSLFPDEYYTDTFSDGLLDKWGHFTAGGIEHSIYYELFIAAGYNKSTAKILAASTVTANVTFREYLDGFQRKKEGGGFDLGDYIMSLSGAWSNLIPDDLKPFKFFHRKYEIAPWFNPDNNRGVDDYLSQSFHIGLDLEIFSEKLIDIPLMIVIGANLNKPGGGGLHLPIGTLKLA